MHDIRFQNTHESFTIHSSLTNIKIAGSVAKMYECMLVFMYFVNELLQSKFQSYLYTASFRRWLRISTIRAPITLLNVDSYFGPAHLWPVIFSQRVLYSNTYPGKNIRCDFEVLV